MAKSHSGGGRTEVRNSTRTGSPAKGVAPGYASQIGQKLYEKGDRAPMQAQEPTRGVPYSMELGNSKALDIGKGGPGAGRVVHRTGSQGQWGEANQGQSPPSRG